MCVRHVYVQRSNIYQHINMLQDKFYHVTKFPANFSYPDVMFYALCVAIHAPYSHVSKCIVNNRENQRRCNCVVILNDGIGNKMEFLFLFTEMQRLTSLLWLNDFLFCFRLREIICQGMSLFTNFLIKQMILFFDFLCIYLYFCFNNVYLLNLF